MCWFCKERTWAPFGFQNPFGHMYMVVTTTKTLYHWKPLQAFQLISEVEFDYYVLNSSDTIAMLYNSH
jgi:hypothetical protein